MTASGDLALEVVELKRSFTGTKPVAPLPVVGRGLSPAPWWGRAACAPG